ncbi:MAG: hypothetical protein MJA83_11720 [Gammaproteobacteria bacterium]|nr:hypothetical protein [Gammaproteobacteria bacterium]
MRALHRLERHLGAIAGAHELLFGLRVVAAWRSPLRPPPLLGRLGGEVAAFRLAPAVVHRPPFFAIRVTRRVFEEHPNEPRHPFGSPRWLDLRLRLAERLRGNLRRMRVRPQPGERVGDRDGVEFVDDVADEAGEPDRLGVDAAGEVSAAPAADPAPAAEPLADELAAPDERFPIAFAESTYNLRHRIWCGGGRARARVHSTAS